MLGGSALGAASGDVGGKRSRAAAVADADTGDSDSDREGQKASVRRYAMTGPDRAAKRAQVRPDEDANSARALSAGVTGSTSARAVASVSGSGAAAAATARPHETLPGFGDGDKYSSAARSMRKRP
jgi:hypothetical protein